MKFSFDYKNIWAIVRKNVRIITLVSILLGVALLSYGTYLILVPSVDPVVQKKENEEMKNIDITFDKKALDDIKNKKSPSVINENGGRNPFLPF